MSDTSSFQLINVGAVPNDGTGDDIRDAFIKINSNFSNIVAIGENVAENGAFGVAVAVGVFVGGMSEKEVAVGIKVKVAGGVSVAVVCGGIGMVAVQVAWS